MWFPSPYAQARSSFEEPVTPPDVDPDAGGLISVSFNPAWLPYVLGALTQLQQPSTWDGDDAAKQLAIDRAILLSNLVGYPVISIPGTEPGTPPPVTRYDPTCDCIQTSTDGGTTWDDAPGADPRNQSPLAPQTGSGAACNSAASERKYLTRWHGLLQTVGGTAITATGLGYSIIGLLIELSGPWAIIADVAIAASLGFIAAGLSAINDAFSDDNLDLIECIIYCHLSSSNQLDASRLGSVESDVTSLIGGTSATIINAVLSLQGYGGINSAMALKLDTDDCSGCDACTWCYTVDLTAGLGAYVTILYGTFVSGSGIQDVFDSAPARLNTISHIRVTLPSSATVTELDMTYQVNMLGSSPVKGFQASNQSVSLKSTALGSGAGSDSVTGTWSYGDYEFYILPARPQNQAGNAWLKSITFKGSGDNPFGGNNC